MLMFLDETVLETVYAIYVPVVFKSCLLQVGSYFFFRFGHQLWYHVLHRLITEIREHGGINKKKSGEIRNTSSDMIIQVLFYFLFLQDLFGRKK